MFSTLHEKNRFSRATLKKLILEGLGARLGARLHKSAGHTQEGVACATSLRYQANGCVLRYGLSSEDNGC